MSKLPRISGKNLIKTLKNFGFETTRVKGSHHILKHKDGRMTVVPVHSKEIIGPGLLSKILSIVKLIKKSLLGYSNEINKDT